MKKSDFVKALKNLKPVSGIPMPTYERLKDILKKNERLIDEEIRKHFTLGEFLVSSFVWSATDENSNYWSYIYDLATGITNPVPAFPLSVPKCNIAASADILKVVDIPTKSSKLSLLKMLAKDLGYTINKEKAKQKRKVAKKG